MPIEKCSECVVKSKNATAGFWTVETLIPKFGTVHKAEVHHVRLGAFLRQIGMCRNIYKATTACGIEFESEVDSSD